MTSRCSRVLWELTNVALVSSDFNKYKMAFLYSLALLWDIDVNTLELDTEPAQAALCYIKFTKVLWSLCRVGARRCIWTTPRRKPQMSSLSRNCGCPEMRIQRCFPSL